MAKSTRSVNERKRPAKTKKRKRRGVPLSVHKATGYWCKRIDGKVHYFGRVEDDPNGVEALQQYENLKQTGDKFAGPDDTPGAHTVRDLANFFLQHKEEQRDRAEISPRTFSELKSTCRRLVDMFGDRVAESLNRDDFAKLRAELSQGRGLVRQHGEITRVRSVFKFGYDNDYIDRIPKYGSAFEKPSADAIAQEQADREDRHGAMLFDAAEVRALLCIASQPMRAMILLGVNCGFGPSDLGSLPTARVDLESGWIEYRRKKRGKKQRRCPLWPETVAAIRSYLEVRRPAADPDDAHLLFRTSRGHRWHSIPLEGAPVDNVSQEFSKYVKKIDKARSDLATLKGKAQAEKHDKLSKSLQAALAQLDNRTEPIDRKGRGFYKLRHTLATIGGDTADQVAVSAILGHVDNSMTARYQHGISDERLLAVSERVRAWLFAEPLPEQLIEALQSCVPSIPCDPRPDRNGTHGSQGTQESAQSNTGEGGER